MTTPIEVTKCGECPLAVHVTGEFFACEAGRFFQGPEQHHLNTDTDEAPEWCPLRTAPVLVTLRGWQSAEAKDVLEGGALR